MRPDTVAATLERHRAHAALVFSLDEELGTHHGIAWSDFALLAALDTAGGALEEQDLAGITSTRRSRLHLQLAPLEKLGLVQRAPAPGRTSRLCALRPGGKRVLEEARRTVADLCEAAGPAGQPFAPQGLDLSTPGTLKIGMMEHTTVVLRDYAPAWEGELVALWRESFEHGVGINDPHPLEEQALYFRNEVLPANAVQVALRGSELVGFVAASPRSIAQLYVRVGCQRQGIGTRLLEWARSRSDGSLWLYTFARNEKARAFYESRGFTAAAHGFEATWQLEDIRYEWQRDRTPAGRAVRHFPEPRSTP